MRFPGPRPQAVPPAPSIDLQNMPPPLFTLFPQGGMNSSLSGHFSWATCKKVIKKRTFSDIIKNHFSTNLVEIHHFEQTCKKKLPKMTLMGYKNGSGGTNFPSELFPLDAFARGGGAETASDDFRGGIWSIIYIGQDDVADHVTTLQAFDQKPDKKMSQFPAGAFTLLRVQKFTKKMHSWCTAQKTPLSHPEKHQNTVQVSFLVRFIFAIFDSKRQDRSEQGFRGSGWAIMELFLLFFI